MTWIVFAGLTALFESLKDVVSKRAMPALDVYLVSWSLFALMLPVLLAVWCFQWMPPLGPDFGIALMMGGTLNAISVVLYITALSQGELSLTVPLIALTPLFLLITAPLLVNELPALSDGLGVLLIVGGAYVLNLRQKQLGWLAPFRAVIDQVGPRLMLLVAFIWSFTANFDKIGVTNSSPTFWVIALFSFIAIAISPMVLLKSEHPLQQIAQCYPRLLLIGGLSCITVLCQMQAIQLSLVTRVIAVKRMSALLGVFWGYALFKEQGIRERAAGTVLMILGVLCITLG